MYRCVYVIMFCVQCLHLCLNFFKPHKNVLKKLLNSLLYSYSILMKQHFSDRFLIDFKNDKKRYFFIYFFLKTIFSFFENETQWYYRFFKLLPFLKIISLINVKGIKNDSSFVSFYFLKKRKAKIKIWSIFPKTMFLKIILLEVYDN